MYRHKKENPKKNKNGVQRAVTHSNKILEDKFLVQFGK